MVFRFSSFIKQYFYLCTALASCISEPNSSYLILISQNMFCISYNGGPPQSLSYLNSPALTSAVAQQGSLNKPLCRNPVGNSFSWVSSWHLLGQQTKQKYLVAERWISVLVIGDWLRKGFALSRYLNRHYTRGQKMLNNTITKLYLYLTNALSFLHLKVYISKVHCSPVSSTCG